MKKWKCFFDAIIYFIMVIILQKIVYYIYSFVVFKIAQKNPELLAKWVYSNVLSPEEKALEVIKTTQIVPILISWALTVGLIGLAFFLAHQRPLENINERLGILNFLLIIIIGFGTVLFTNGILSTVNSLISLTTNTHYDFGHSYFYGTIIIVGIITPIFEEVVFRGFILNRLLEVFSKGFAVFIQAILFSVSHLDIIQGITIFPLGLIAGYIVMKTKSVKGGIVVHAIFNITNLYLNQNNHHYYNGGQLVVFIILGTFMTYFGMEKIKVNKANFKAKSTGL